MKAEARKSLHDAFTAAQEIQSFLTDVEFSDFLTNRMIQAAVERKFEIIGEAFRRLSDIDPELLNQISDHKRIIGFRNILAHGYDVVDPEIVWSAATDHIPILLLELTNITTEG